MNETGSGVCVTCQAVEKLYRRNESDKTLFTIHTERVFFQTEKKSQLDKQRKETKERGKSHEKEKLDAKEKEKIAKQQKDKREYVKQKKKGLSQKICKYVSALRNSGGGVLLLHVYGTESEDKYLQYFDEFVNNIFSDLLEPGELYTDTYRRQWLSEFSCFKRYPGFIKINVNTTPGVATVEFNTKIRKDHENVNPTSLQLRSVLSNSVQAIVTTRDLSEEPQLHENRFIELKSPLPFDGKIAIPKVVDYIWNQMKLKDNITSMSKLAEGGSYYLGIEEKDVLFGEEDNAYDTKVTHKTGISLSKLNVTEDSLKEQLHLKVQNDLRFLSKDHTFQEAPQDLICVKLNKVPNNPTKHVLEVNIRFLEGIVFYDQQGPRAYTIKEETIERMSRDEWLQRVLS